LWEIFGKGNPKDPNCVKEREFPKKSTKLKSFSKMEKMDPGKEFKRKVKGK